ncbi:sensor histidine kinase [Streptomyces sp. NPDC057638]|uniref:sensor histidine kinase n=1 Tax=Streptomyces sp. NPDC057638 TaxID=3346190 RepID=UPI0036A7F130
MGELLGGRARRRWVHLVLGGALMVPFWIVGTLLTSPLHDGVTLFGGSLSGQLLGHAAGLPLVAVASLLPLARPLAAAVTRTLCGVVPEDLAEGPARSWAARWRTAVWFTLHLGIGAVVSGASLALPPFAATVFVVPFFPRLREFFGVSDVAGWWLALFPPAAVVMLSALAGCSAAAGLLLARLAPVLLGPTPADRLAAAERRATALAERNRLARELHDSVGHALSAVALQAGAARRVFASDPAFVREALAAIEETTRRTVGELDAVLGLLRDDGGGGREVTGPTLEALDGLVARSGVPVTVTAEGDPGTVPAPVSREAYRIVQEGLGNALRHAGAVPVGLWIAVRGEELEITVENPLPARPPVTRPGGGRGLRGVGERAALLGGAAHAGPDDGRWRLRARLPLHGGAPVPRATTEDARTQGGAR